MRLRPNFLPAVRSWSGSPAQGGKITPEALRQTLDRFPRGLVKSPQPGALSLSQVSEAGTVYRVGEIQELSAVARAAGISVHMDGARFANAVVTCGCSPAEMTWRAGVDALSFGATKNGALACEAVVFFDLARAVGIRLSAQARRAYAFESDGFSARRWRPI